VVVQAGLLGLIAAALGCTTGPSPGPAAPDPAWLAGLAAPLPKRPERNWPIPPGQAERVLAQAKGIVKDQEKLAAGVTGADRFTIHFADLRRDLVVKWKAGPKGDVDGWNNAPRKELAAYEFQKWFLPPEAYLVPTTVARCISMESYRHIDAKAEPTLEGTRCVFGVLSLWLENVEVPEPLYDEERFLRDPAYARHLANFNVFTHLIDDRDTRKGNVLTSTDARNRRVFSVDNGISFDASLYNIFDNAWKEIRVPALPRDSIERLRALAPERIRALAVVAEFQVDETGMLRRAAAGQPIADDRGVRFEDGRLQLGLTADEIENVRNRLKALLDEVDQRRIPLF
jgi:hypothetical protein